uniref:Uncharacterized protein n=1 Tax=Ixodes ricinus TaxID=34613 RepID=A0A6B0UXS7_IXORI
MRLRMNSASLATLTMWSFMAWESSRPSLMSSMKARPACFCSEFCHSWEQSNITSSTTDVLFLKVLRPFPSTRRSCPCDPTRVRERKGAKSTMISLRSGHTLPRAPSSFWVRLASLVLGPSVTPEGPRGARRRASGPPAFRLPPTPPSGTLLTPLSAGSWGTNMVAG